MADERQQLHLSIVARIAEELEVKCDYRREKIIVAYLRS